MSLCAAMPSHLTGSLNGQTDGARGAAEAAKQAAESSGAGFEDRGRILGGRAKGYDDVSVGLDSSASNGQSTAVGHSAHADSMCSTAIGEESLAEGILTTALGSCAVADGVGSFAVGAYAKARKGEGVLAVTQETNYGYETSAVSLKLVGIGSDVSAQQLDGEVGLGYKYGENDYRYLKLCKLFDLVDKADELLALLNR